MATALTPKTVLGGYRTLPVTANELDVTLAAADTAGNTFTPQLGDVIFVRNSGAGSHTVTITSYANTRTLNRSGDLGPYTLGAGEYYAYKVTALDGLVDPDTGIMTVTCNHAECLIAVFR